MRDWLRHPVYTVVLALVWMVLQERASVGDFVIGYGIGAIIVFVHRDFWAERVRILRPLMLVRLALVFLAEVVKANLQVAWIVIQPRLRIRPAFIVLPLRLTDDLQITALANMITLTPGTLTVDVAPDRSALYVHCLSADDVESVREQIKRQFEKPLEEAIRCSPL
ncbi:MAG: Na+/H+ antiporter subunit E [Candidatus Binatia bacterium]